MGKAGDKRDLPMEDTVASDAGAPAVPKLPPDEPTLRAPTAPSDYADFREVDAAHYSLGQELARGGMGRVRAARDRRLGRNVAVKELLVRSASDARRFEREALITARLQHPSIVRIYEAGRWPTGEPFYAMEMVSGRSLDRVIAETHTLDERLALLPNLTAVAEALAYAHAQRIIHRDLKPANVLVGAFGETIVIDWGLAKDLGNPTPDDSLPLALRAPPSPPSESPSPSAHKSSPSVDMTVDGSIMGTPSYMPPEQARGQRVDERADVYALGAMLYCLLAGRPPFVGASSAEVLSEVLSGPPKPLESVQPGVPPDLATIVDRAMAADPGDRYPTAQELVDELKRFRTGRLVASHKYRLSTLLRRFIQRNRGAVGVAVAGVLALAALGAVSVQRIVRARDLAESARREAEVERGKAVLRADELTLGQARQALDRDPTMALAWLKELSPESPRWPAARAIAVDALARGVARVLTGHSDDVEHVRFSPDGARFISASSDHTVRLWDPTRLTSVVLSGHTGKIQALSFAPDSQQFATGSMDQTVRVWDARTGEGRLLSGHGGTVRDVAFTLDGKQLASGSEDHTVRLWDLATGHARTLVSFAGAARELRLSPDGKLLAAGSEDGRVALIDVGSGLVVRTLAAHTATVRALAFSPDGTRLATCAEDGTTRVWDVASGAGRVFAGHTDTVKDLAFSPDGAQLATASADHTVRLWDVKSGRGRALTGHSAGIKHLAYAPDGKTLASGGSDGSVRLWALDGSTVRVLLGHSASLKGLSFRPDGSALLSASDDDTVRFWPLGDAPPPPADPAALRAWLDATTNLRVTR